MTKLARTVTKVRIIANEYHVHDDSVTRRESALGLWCARSDHDGGN